jgi:beta-glucan synthesis-associated protein KRE6
MLSNYSWNYKDVDLVDEAEDKDFENMKDLSTPFTLFSWRGWVNIGTIMILAFALMMLFAGYPVVLWIKKRAIHPVSYNVAKTNGTGQVPSLPGLRTLIDPDTDQSAYTRTGNDGYTYELVFSDEFNLDGRTFYPGDDPYWEAVDMHYWLVFCSS